LRSDCDFVLRADGLEVTTDELLLSSYALYDSRFFGFDALHGSHSSYCKPDVWVDGYECFRREQEKATGKLLSNVESNSSNQAAKEQEPIGRSVEAEFHIRLVERKIDQTLTAFGAFRV
jgi:hypothetical protein